jgi:hypothetical protein
LAYIYEPVEIARIGRVAPPPPVKVTYTEVEIEDADELPRFMVVVSPSCWLLL